MFYNWREYKLRLNAKGVVQLEERLGGRSPLSIFSGVSNSELPALKDLLIVLHESLQPYHHGMTLDKAYELYDEFIEEGHNFAEFLSVIVEIYRNSGLIPREEDSKN